MMMMIIIIIMMIMIITRTTTTTIVIEWNEKDRNTGIEWKGKKWNGKEEELN